MSCGRYKGVLQCSAVFRHTARPGLKIKSDVSPARTDNKFYVPVQPRPKTVLVHLQLERTHMTWQQIV